MHLMQVLECTSSKNKFLAFYPQCRKNSSKYLFPNVRDRIRTTPSKIKVQAQNKILHKNL